MKCLILLSTLSILYLWATPRLADCKPATHDSDDVVKKIDKFVDEMVKCHPPPAFSLAVVKDGQVVLTRGYGHTSADKKVKATSKTQFAIGSLTKAFTSFLAAKFTRESTPARGSPIKLDTPIIKYIQDFRLVDDYRSEHTTLRDLLSHRMNIPDDSEPIALMGFGAKIPLPEFARKLALLTSPSSFRENFIYNNFMFTLVGALLEELSNGSSWEDQVRHSIFNPLQMSDSGFVNGIKDFGNFALACDIVDGNLTDASPDLFSTYHVAGPAGTIYSSADDMAKWMNFLMSKDKKEYDHRRVVSDVFKPSMEAWRINDLTQPSYPISHDVHEYALAWFTGLYREYRQITHSGGILTHSSNLDLYPDMDIGIYMARNGPVKDDGSLMTSIRYYVADLMLGLPPWFNSSDVCSPPYPWQAPAASETKDNEIQNDSPLVSARFDFDEFVGKYEHVIYGDVMITLNSSTNILNFSYEKFGRMELTHYSESMFSGKLVGLLSFYNAHYNPAVYFHMDDVDSVLALSFDLYGSMQFVGPFYKV